MGTSYWRERPVQHRTPDGRLQLTTTLAPGDDVFWNCPGCKQTGPIGPDGEWTCLCGHVWYKSQGMCGGAECYHVLVRVSDALPALDSITELVDDHYRAFERRLEQERRAFWERIPIDLALPPWAIYSKVNVVTGEGCIVARGADVNPDVPYIGPAHGS